MFVGLGIEGVEALAGWVVGDHRLGSAFDQELAQAVAVIGCVGGAQARRRQWAQQRQSGPEIAELTRGYFEGDGPPAAIDNGVDFGRPAAPRAANRLRLGPPFPPAAERCALAVVLSMIWM